MTHQQRTHHRADDDAEHRPSAADFPQFGVAEGFPSRPEERHVGEVPLGVQRRAPRQREGQCAQVGQQHQRAEHLAAVEVVRRGQQGHEGDHGGHGEDDEQREQGTAQGPGGGPPGGPGGEPGTGLGTREHRTAHHGGQQEGPQQREPRRRRQLDAAVRRLCQQTEQEGAGAAERRDPQDLLQDGTLRERPGTTASGTGVAGPPRRAAITSAPAHTAVATSGTSDSDASPASPSPNDPRDAPALPEKLTPPPTLCNSSARAIRIRVPQPRPASSVSSEEKIPSRQARTRSTSVGHPATFRAATQSPFAVRVRKAPRGEGRAGAAYGGWPGGAAGAGGAPGAGRRSAGRAARRPAAPGRTPCRTAPRAAKKNHSPGRTMTRRTPGIQGQRGQLPLANVQTRLSYAWFPAFHSL